MRGKAQKKNCVTSQSYKVNENSRLICPISRIACTSLTKHDLKRRPLTKMKKTCADWEDEDQQTLDQIKNPILR